MINHDEHLLICLSEECVEVSQQVSKALRFGLQDIKPGQPYTNAQRIAQEIGDLLAVKQILEERGLLPTVGMEHWIDRKKAKLAQYMDYSVKCGALEASAVLKGGKA